MKIYQHTKGKYQSLNHKNQTPKKFVTGQKYKLGTGVILVQSDSDAIEKITFQKQRYKKFLSQIVDNELDAENIIAFKWLPKKIIHESTIHIQKCGQECVNGSGCVELGCICVETEERCR